ncbi:TPA: phage antirepressor KilAC domain-containing protein [Bacillus cereus]|nr:phage antirepressor KilAC domain-containing protein [Bacillus cereus]
MMTNLQVFENGLGELRVVQENGSTWFVAKDTAKILGYSETSAMTRYLDEDEFMSIKLAGMNMKSIVLNESGLYSVIMQSKKPQAKAFRKWVTSEVLPSIRRDGGYMVAHEEESEADLMARAVLLAQQTLARKDKQLRQAQEQLDDQAPVIEYYEKVISTEGYKPVAEIAKELGLRSPQELYGMLVKKNIIFKSRKGSYLHRPDYAYLKADNHISYKQIEKGKVQLLINHKGKHEIAKLLKLV